MGLSITAEELFEVLEDTEPDTEVIIEFFKKDGSIEYYTVKSMYTNGEYVRLRIADADVPDDVIEDYEDSDGDEIDLTN